MIESAMDVADLELDASTAHPEETTSQKLFSHLFEACNILRGPINQDEYKSYVTPILFFKRLSDVYDEETQVALEESGGDEEYASFAENHRFVIPNGCHWQDVREASENVGVAIVNAMNGIERANPDTLSGVFSSFDDANWTDKTKLSDERLKDLIEHMSKLKVGNNNYSADVMGDSYEFLIKKFADLSKKNAADAQVLMRNYMMERFLERISLSEYRDKFILKGGMLVAAMVGLDARSTMDLDATVKGANVNVEDIENLISAIVSVPLDDGVKFQLKSISEIMDEAEYPGIRVNMTTTFDGVVTPLKIDISTGDAITPREIRYSFKLMLEDRSIDIWAYNLETVLAEKLETIITRTTTNTRMRDFYDIYILEQLHGNTLDPQILHDALRATAHKRGTERHLAEAAEVFEEVENSSVMQKLWESYRRKFSYAADLEWNIIMGAVRSLYALSEKESSL